MHGENVIGTKVSTRGNLNKHGFVSKNLRYKPVFSKFYF